MSLIVLFFLIAGLGLIAWLAARMRAVRFRRSVRDLAQHALCVGVCGVLERRHGAGRIRIVVAHATDEARLGAHARIIDGREVVGERDRIPADARDADLMHDRIPPAGRGYAARAGG